MALIIEKAKPTLTRVELYLSTLISRRNNDLIEANYQSQREEEQRSEGKNRFV